MQLGMIGLGRMGANMVRRLAANGHQCVGFNRSPQIVEQMAAEKVLTASTSIEDLLSKLTKPRAVWLMIPAAAVDDTIAQIVLSIESGVIAASAVAAAYYHVRIFFVKRKLNRLQSSQ